MVAALTLGLIGSAALAGTTVFTGAIDFPALSSEVQRPSLRAAPLGVSPEFRIDARGQFRIPRSLGAQKMGFAFSTANPVTAGRRDPVGRVHEWMGWGVPAPNATTPLRRALFISNNLPSLADGLWAQNDFRPDTGVDGTARRQVHHGRMSATLRAKSTLQAEWAWGPCWGCESQVGPPGR